MLGSGDLIPLYFRRLLATLVFIITTGSALCEHLSLPLERNPLVMRCHYRTHQCRGKPVDLKTMLAHARSDAEDARIATEKALESQEEEIVTKFSSMTVFDKIVLGIRCIAPFGSLKATRCLEHV